MATLMYNPADTLETEEERQKRLKEEQHNVAAPPIYPYQNDPNQAIPLIRQAPPVTQVNAQGLQVQPQASQNQTQPQAPQINPVTSTYQPNSLQQQALNTGYNAVIQGYNSPVNDLTSQKTQYLLQNPGLGYDAQKINQSKMEQFDLNKNQAFEKARQATAPISGSGKNIEDLTRLSLTNAVERSGFESQLQDESMKKSQQDFLATLAEGRATAETERQKFNTNIGGLSTILAAGEGQENRNLTQAENAVNRGFEWATQNASQDFQKELATLQGKIASGQQMSQNDWNSAQNQLSRELELAKIDKNAAKEKELQNLQQQFTAQQQELQRQFLSSESNLERLGKLTMQEVDISAQKEIEQIRGKIQQGLQLSQNDFVASQSSLDRQLKDAMQNKDIGAQQAAIQKQLDFDKWKTEAGFKFTEEQNSMNRALESSLQLGNQQFQEKMLGLKEKVDMNLMITDQQWKATQSDLDRQLQDAIATKNITAQQQIIKMQQEFQGLQNDLNRKQETDIQNMVINQDKWKTDRTEQLTKLGWKQDEAMQQSQFENQKYMQDYDWKKKELMQQGMNQFEAEQQAKQWAYHSKESDLDRQLQKEIESGRIRLEDRKLLQDSQQFKDKQSFDKWAIEQGIDQQKADRIWQSGENALNRTHDIYMEQIKEEFQKKGMDLQYIMSQIENMNPDQAAAALKKIAEDSGITYNSSLTQTQIGQTYLSKYNLESLDKPGLTPDQIGKMYSEIKSKWLTDAKSLGVSESDAIKIIDNYVDKRNDDGKIYSITGKGLKPTSEGVINKIKNDIVFEQALAKIDEGQKLTTEEYASLASSGKFKTAPYFGTDTIEYTQDARGNTVGYRAWRFKDDVYNWIQSNQGNIFVDQNGDLVKLTGFYEPGTNKDDRLTKAYMTFERLKDNSTYNYNGR
ncbi:MAG: hypothetical protein EHM12_11125 [Dehalococcoidia bacterium]|nr:MAG: hypothetical protein EHM12_11125 [Dehalococcoidia bacterium]